jgi:GNAT superfamily N-acetyltransferase
MDEAARGSGTGRALVAAPKEQAWQWNCLAVEVTRLRTRADAHAFYKRLGFADICPQSGRFKKALSLNGGDC